MRPGMRPGMRVAQLLNIAFDMAAWEILGSFSNGCMLILRGKSSKDWKTALKNMDIVIATPSILGSHEPDDYPNIKYIATAGEVCPQSLADKWSKYTLFHNSCGPTEASSSPLMLISADSYVSLIRHGLTTSLSQCLHQVEYKQHRLSK